MQSIVIANCIARQELRGAATFFFNVRQGTTIGIHPHYAYAMYAAATIRTS